MANPGQLRPSRQQDFHTEAESNQNEYSNIYNASSNMSDVELLEEILNLQPVKEMKVTIKTSIKYGVIVGAATVVSGILGGPVGLAVGGVVSSCITGYVSDQEYESVPYILLYKTDPTERQKLLKVILNYLRNNKVILNYLRNNKVTIVKTLCALHRKEALILGIRNIICDFLKELGLKVVKTW